MKYALAAAVFAAGVIIPTVLVTILPVSDAIAMLLGAVCGGVGGFGAVAIATS